MKKKLSRKLLQGIIAVAIILILILLKYSTVYNIDLAGFILECDDGYTLYLNNNDFIVLDGLLGNVAVSKDGNKGVFFRENQNGQVEIAEITFANAQIRLVVEAEMLKKSMWEANETEYSGGVSQRPESIGYVNGENLISFVWNNALYQMDFMNDQIYCVIEKLDRTELVLEGQDYAWINEKELVYATSDERGINSIVKYNLQTQDKQFVHYGTGVSLPEDGENMVCYQTYIKDSTTWEHFHEFSVINIDSLEIEGSYTYREVNLFQPGASVIFQCGNNNLILWGRKGDNCLYFYDFENEKLVKKKLWRKRIYSILEINN